MMDQAEAERRGLRVSESKTVVSFKSVPGKRGVISKNFGLSRSPKWGSALGGVFFFNFFLLFVFCVYLSALSASFLLVGGNEMSTC